METKVSSQTLYFENKIRLTVCKNEWKILGK